MSLKNIVDAVAAKRAAAAPGKVNKYERNATDEAVFKDAFIDDQSGGAVRASTITREQTPANDRTMHGVERVHTIVLREFMALSDADATELTFRDQLEAICNSFDADRNLGGVCLQTTPMSVRRETKVEISGVLSHYGELVIGATEYPL